MIRILVIIIFLMLPTEVFAQEYLTVNPPFLKDGSDACSKIAPYPIGRHVEDPEQWVILPDQIPYINNTAVTTLYYNNTKLVVSFSPSVIDNDLHLVYEAGNGLPPLIHISDSKLLPASPTKKLVLEHNMTGQFTEALTNIGNKKVILRHPSDYVLQTVVFWKNDTVVTPYFLYNGIYGYNMETPNTKGTVLEPHQSIINGHRYLPRPLGFDTPDNSVIAPPGNYTVRTFARVIGDVHGTCMVVNLWSQPIDLEVIPQNKVPEFPFVIPVFLISFVSVIVFYRLRFVK